MTQLTKLISKLSAICALSASLVSCGGTPASRQAGALPFILKVNKIRIVSESSDEKPELPAVFGDPALLRSALVDRLAETGLFTAITTEGEDFDLELTMTIQGDDFHAGRVKAGGATLSTLAWLFAGHLSWVIDDRSYPDSDISMSVTIDRPAQQVGQLANQTVFQGILELENLASSLSERSQVSQWLVNIFVPPWWGDGDLETTGASLVQRSLDYFAENESTRMAALLPFGYHSRMNCFLVHDPLRSEIIILARAGISEVIITSASRHFTRSLYSTELEGLKVRESEETRTALEISQRSAGIGITENDRFFRIALGPEATGLLKIKAVMSNDESTGQWSVVQPLRKVESGTEVQKEMASASGARKQ